MIKHSEIRTDEGVNLHAIRFSDGADVVRTCDSTGDRSLLLVVGKTLTSKICAPTLRALDDDWGVNVAEGSHVRPGSRTEFRRRTELPQARR